jgi:hypothetical protein
VNIPHKHYRHLFCDTRRRVGIETVRANHPRKEFAMKQSFGLEPIEPSSLLTRREFTLDAALALLAGCVITISEGCGKSSTSPSEVPPTDITGVISANHNHSAVINAAQITAAAAFTLNIQGTAAHPHTVALTQGDLTSLKSRQSITKDSSSDLSNTFGLHSHSVTFTPM